MKENVEVDNCPIKGEVLIQKFDKDGKLIYEESGNNIIKQFVTDYIKTKWRASIAAWCPNLSTQSAWDDFNYYDLLRYVYLVDSEIVPTLEGEPVFPVSGYATLVTGELNRQNRTIGGSDSKVGIIQYETSYNTSNKSVFVYEWGLDKGDGVFNTIVHANLPSSTIQTNIDNCSVEEIQCMNPAIGEATSFDYDGIFSIYEYNGVMHMVRNLSIDLTSGTYPLSYDDLNMSTGIVTTRVLENFGNRFNGNQPDLVNAFIDVDGKITLIVRWSGSEAFLFRDLGLGDNSWQIVALGISMNSCISEGNYVYIKTGSNTRFYRFLKTTTTPATEYVTIANEACYYLNGVVYSRQSRSAWDASSSSWNGDGATLISHKYGFKNFVTQYGEFAYGRQSIKQWITGDAYSPSGEYRIVRCKINQYRKVETAHYKMQQYVTKSAAETLKITYTFNFT